MFNTGETVFIYHYSGTKPYKCSILEEKDDILKVCIDKGYAYIELLKNDPTVIAYLQDNEIKTLGSYIVGIDNANSKLELRIDDEHSVPGQERRIYERYPVSLYADIKTKAAQRATAILKNISYSGMLIYSKSEFPVDTVIDIDIFLDKQVMDLKAKVIRAVKRADFNEYGLQVIYSSYDAMDSMKKFVESLRYSQASIVQKAFDKGQFFK